MASTDTVTQSFYIFPIALAFGMIVVVWLTYSASVSLLKNTLKGKKKD